MSETSTSGLKTGATRKLHFSIVGSWVLAFLCVFGIVIFAQAEYVLQWISASLCGFIALALIIQVATREKNGFVDRLGSSITGIFIIFALSFAVLTLTNGLQ